MVVRLMDQLSHIAGGVRKSRSAQAQQDSSYFSTANLKPRRRVCDRPRTAGAF